MKLKLPNFLKHLKTWSKRKIIVAVLMFVALAGTGGFVLKNKFSADTATTRSVIISGSFINNITKIGVVGATISAKSSLVGSSPIVVKTDYAGNYSVNITISKIDPSQKNFYIRTEIAGYPTMTRESDVPDGWSGVRNVNFSSAPFSIDVASVKVLDAVSSRCRTAPDTYEYYSYFYHPGDYVAKEINGILFCASVQNSAYFDTYKGSIAQNAVLIKSLVDRTGLSYTPKIYLSGPITWMPWEPGSTLYPGGYAGVETREIVFDVNQFSNDTATITHEFGHLVDWDKGYDILMTDPNPNFCLINKIKTKKHCFSSNNQDFAAAFSISRQQIISSYAINYRGEMFAEMFSAQQTPQYIGSNNFPNRQLAQENLTNALLGKYYSNSSGPDRILAVNMPVSTTQQNAAMYVYKFVAQKSNIDEYFPGTIGNWGYNDIWYGKYMGNQSVVSVRLTDHAGKPMEQANVMLTGIPQTTKNDISHPGLTGTAVFNYGPIGKQTFTIPNPPDYYKGAVFAGQDVNLQPGSNPVIELKYNKFSTSVNFGFKIKTTPAVQTFYPGTVTSKSFVANGKVVNTGFNPATGLAKPTAGKWGFDYGTSTSSTTRISPGTSIGVGSFTRTIPNLSPATTYFVRAFVITPSGEPVYGQWLTVKTFETSGYNYPYPPSYYNPAVQTFTAGLTTTPSSSFVAKGSITTNNGGTPIVQRGFNYGTQTDYETVYDDGSFGTGDFSKLLSGLPPEAGYQVRAFASNAYGTGFGPWVFASTLIPGVKVKGSFKAANGVMTSGLVLGSLSRYPAEGTIDGLSGPVVMRRGMVSYILGGGGTALYPIKETFTTEPVIADYPTTLEFIRNSSAIQNAYAKLGMSCFSIASATTCPKLQW